MKIIKLTTILIFSIANSFSIEKISNEKVAKMMKAITNCDARLVQNLIPSKISAEEKYLYQSIYDKTLEKQSKSFMTDNDGLRLAKGITISASAGITSIFGLLTLYGIFLDPNVKDIKQYSIAAAWTVAGISALGYGLKNLANGLLRRDIKQKRKNAALIKTIIDSVEVENISDKA